MSSGWTRRAWIGGLAATAPAARLRAQRPGLLGPATRKAAEAAFRREMGRRRAGFAVLPIGREADLYIPAPQGASDRLLDAAQVLWRPGSTVKPFLLERLLDAGLVSATSEYRCQGKLRVENRVLDCAHASQPMPLLPAEALALSCNEYFIHYAARLPVGAFARTLAEAGVGDRQPFGRDCAPAGVEIPSDMDSHLLQCVGESHVFTSPLALLAAFAQLLSRMRDRPETASARVLGEGMRECVNQGTGVGARVPSLDVAGKTGTGGARARTHLNGWFLSYAPSAAPRYAMVTFVEHGSGGGDAAPLAAAVWKVLGEYDALG